MVNATAVQPSSYGCTWEVGESTQEARVALGYCLEQLLRFFHCWQLSRPGRVLHKVLYGEASPRGPTPYPFIYHF